MECHMRGRVSRRAAQHCAAHLPTGLSSCVPLMTLPHLARMALMAIALAERDPESVNM